MSVSVYFKIKVNRFFELRVPWWNCCIMEDVCAFSRLIFVQGRRVDCVWNVMAHAQKPDLVFRRNGRVHLNRRGLQFSRLLAA